MDTTDQRLVELLKLKPRATNRAIATELGLSEPTVASRITRLENESTLRIMAVLKMGAAGFEHLVLFGVRVADRHPDLVAAEIAQIPEVSGLTSTFGRFELVGTIYAKDKIDIARLMDHRVGTIAGVQDLESGLILETLAFRPDAGTLDAMTEAPRPVGEGGTLDALDLGIVDCLQEDGRMSYREVGRRMDAPEATIRSRLRRLEASSKVSLHAVTNVDFANSGEVSAWVVLRVRGGSLDALAKNISGMDEVGFLGSALGRFNLIALLILPSRKALLDFIFERIAPLHGIQQMETWEIVRSYKHDIRIHP